MQGGPVVLHPVVDHRDQRTLAPSKQLYYFMEPPLLDALYEFVIDSGELVAFGKSWVVGFGSHSW